MPGSRTAIDDLTERRRGPKTQVHRLPTPSDTGARRAGDFTLSQSLRVPPPATARSAMWENAPASRPQPRRRSEYSPAEGHSRDRVGSFLPDLPRTAHRLTRRSANTISLQIAVTEFTNPTRSMRISNSFARSRHANSTINSSRRPTTTTYSADTSKGDLQRRAADATAGSSSLARHTTAFFAPHAPGRASRSSRRRCCAGTASWLADARASSGRRARSRRPRSARRGIVSCG
jgi:hypothetical protein